MEVMIMELLASCSLEQAKGFNGKLVIPNEDSKKPDKVFLNVEYQENDGSVEDFFKSVSELNKGIVKCVSFPAFMAGVKVPEEWKGKTFINTDIDTVEGEAYPNEADGVIDLVHLDSDFPSNKYKMNLRDLVRFCEKHPSVRVIGGNLLAVRGLRIGRFDSGKDKMSSVFKDIYDSFVEVNLGDLDGLKEIVTRTRKKAEANESGGGKAKVRTKGNKSTKPKEKKSSKRAEAAMRLFGNAEEDF